MIPTQSFTLAIPASMSVSDLRVLVDELASYGHAQVGQMADNLSLMIIDHDDSPQLSELMTTVVDLLLENQLIKSSDRPKVIDLLARFESMSAALSHAAYHLTEAGFNVPSHLNRWTR